MKTRHNIAIVLLTLLALLAGFYINAFIGPQHDRKVLGRVEAGYILKHIDEEQVKLNIRMDTGALTSSLSAHDIKLIKKDGKRWVRFVIEPERTGGKIYQFELPLKRMVKIRKRASEMSEDDSLFDRRPVVEMHVCLGHETRLIEVSLTDRSNFAYPMLLGRSAMETFNVLIDPTLVFTTKPICHGMISNEL